MPAVIGPLQWLIDVFEHVLLFFHDTLGAGWGVSIILMTVTVRALMLPLTYKQFKSMREMQRISPLMKDMQKKYKDDKERLAQEMQKIYKEHGVNPFASCLPLVAQFPAFIALFYMLRHDLKADICGAGPIRAAAKEAGKTIVNTGCHEVAGGAPQASFAFIHDLTASAHGGTLIALLVMYIGSQLLSMIFMRNVSAMDPKQAQQQRLLLMGMPFVFVLFVRNFPAGLLVYWITTNLWTFTQGAIMRRGAGPPLPVPGAPPAEEKDDEPSGFLTNSGLAALFSGNKAKTAEANGSSSNGSTSGRSSNGAGSAAKVTNKKAGTAAAKAQPRASGGAKPRPATSGPPPASPRKKKKKSGRRR